MAKRGITYIKGEEPNFLKKFKQQVTFAGERCRPVKVQDSELIISGSLVNVSDTGCNL